MRDIHITIHIRVINFLFFSCISVLLIYWIIILNHDYVLNLRKEVILSILNSNVLTINELIQIDAIVRSCVKDVPLVFDFNIKQVLEKREISVTYLWRITGMAIGAIGGLVSSYANSDSSFTGTFLLSLLGIGRNIVYASLLLIREGTYKKGLKELIEFMITENQSNEKLINSIYEFLVRGGRIENPIMSYTEQIKELIKSLII